MAREMQVEHRDSSSLVDTHELLNAAEDAPPSGAVEVVARMLLTSLGATEVTFFIADLSGENMFPVTRIMADKTMDPQERVGAIPVSDSHEGIALRRQRTQIVGADHETLVFAPVTSRGEALGVLALKLPNKPSPDVIDAVNATAHTLAYVVIANRRHTDLYEWGQRSRALTLAGEIQRRLLPDSFTCEAGAFTLAGWLEPSSECAGDTFDYSFDSDNLSLSITDAMGHSVEAALLATVAVSALRNSRQSGAAIGTRAASANDAVVAYGTRDEFVTGLLVTIPLAGKKATIVNAGHPSPFLFRGDEVTALAFDADLPFGISHSSKYHPHEFDLRIGDRLIFVTDGLVERNAPAFDIASVIRDLADLHPREVVQELCRRVANEAGGQLDDDATVLCLDWHGGVGGLRKSHVGADNAGASI